jgi:hypothetical protein
MKKKKKMEKLLGHSIIMTPEKKHFGGRWFGENGRSC